MKQYGSDIEDFEPSDQLEIARKVKTGFETRISLGKNDAPQYVRVVALDDSGEMLGAANVVDLDKAEVDKNGDAEDEDDSSGGRG